jgi:threonine/homoserine/homoserine lactone efflux protein
MTVSASWPLIAKGLLLGWSIAWPPGPINSEMIRRGLSRGFWQAWAVGLGACTGDFLWALAVTLGAGVLTKIPGVRTTLAAISLILLLLLAFVFFRNAIHGLRLFREGSVAPVASALDSSKGGYLLGIGMALSSPWNIAFWLAVIGQQTGVALSLVSSLTLAAAVVLGASAWGFFLCTTVRLGARFATPRWEIVTNGVTGLLMLYFAVQLIRRMVAPEIL